MEMQFPNLAEATNNLDPRLLNVVGTNLEFYSVEVQIEYQAYREFQMEYEHWLDEQEEPNFMQDF